MKRFLLFWAFLCFGALSVLAQQKTLPVVQSETVISQPLRIIVQMPSMTRLTWGRVHYGGAYGRSVVFWQPLTVYMQPMRMVYLPASVSDSLFGQVRRLQKNDWRRGESAERGFLQGFRKSATAPQMFIRPPQQMFGYRQKPDTLIFVPHR